MGIPTSLKLTLCFVPMCWGCIAPVQPVNDLRDTDDSQVASKQMAAAVTEIPSQSMPLSLPSLDSASCAGLVAEAIRTNRGLKSAFLHYNSMLYESTVDGSLPDPTLTYSEFLQSVETRVGPQQQRISITQPIPWFGKLKNRSKAARLRAQAFLASWEAKRNALLYEIQKTYYSLMFTTNAIEITQDALDLLSSWESVLAQKIRTQGHPQTDIIRVQVELGKLENILAQYRDKRIPLLAHLNALRNRPAEEDIPLPSEKPNTELDSRHFPKSVDQTLRTSLLSCNPELRRLRHLQDAAQANVQLAGLNYFPDLGLGLSYTQTGIRPEPVSGNGTDAVMLNFSLTLPWNQKKYDAAYESAALERESVAELENETKLLLEAKLAEGLFQLHEAARKMLLYKNTLLPKAEESLETSYTSFESGQLPFLDVVDAERTVLDFELELARAVADYRTAIAGVLSIVGCSESETFDSGKEVQS